MYQCFLYTGDPTNPSNRDSNYYAFPLAISPVVDTVDRRVIRIDRLPTGAGFTATPPTTPPSKISPPSEYSPEHQRLRTDVKPIQVVQPEGVSFHVTPTGAAGHRIDWQKWSLRVGFNQREGVVIHDVGLDDPPSFPFSLPPPFPFTISPNPRFLIIVGTV